jgi:crotonobetainyl-CoA:carnitine CoA-transferase CaiB-like acyl-CoA transferase
VAGLLSDLRVVELGEMVSAPYAAKLLADLGADVVKVELPEGDPARRRGPFPSDAPDPEASGLFLYLNTNKRGVRLDLATPRGREALLRLAAGADLLVENLGPRRMELLGLGAAVLAEANPRLVVASISPFGQSGPYRDHAANDLVVFHMSGYGYHLGGAVDDPAREPPLKAAEAQADFVAGVNGALAALAALFARDRTSLGQRVDVAALEALVPFSFGEVTRAVYEGASGSRRRAENPPTGTVAVLPTADGHVAISPREEHLWARWLEVMGSPPWAADERFRDRAARTANWAALEPLLAAWTRERTKEEVFRAAQAVRVPAFPVNSIDGVFDWPQLAARGFFQEVEHPRAGRLRYPTAPYRFSAGGWELRRPAPLLGEHDSDVFLSPWETMGEAGVGASLDDGERRDRGGTTSSIRLPPSPDPRPSPGPSPGGRAGDVRLPLAGVRVVELTWVIAGPLTTKYLALLGAEVIRIESARRAEFRARGGQFALLNDNKKSCRLDLSQPRARELARALAARADVVVDNFGTGVVDRLGLGYEALRQLKPDLVVLSISGVGRTGPDADKLAYGTLLQLASGWSAMQGHPGTDEVVVGGAWTDPLSAATCAFAVLAALRHRARTGQGQLIDFSMVEATLCGVPEALLDYAMNRRLPPRRGNRDRLHAPHGVYPCRGEDRWAAIAVTSEQEWQALVAALGAPAWAADPRFAAAAGRKQHEDELDALIAAWTAERSTGEVVELLQGAGVPSGPVLPAAELLDDPHLRARGLFVETQAPLGGRRLTIGAPWRIEPGFEPVYAPAPRLGEHDGYVFRELLGLSEAEVAALVESKVIF